MATFTVQQGKRYRATITLGWLERLAGNDVDRGEIARRRLLRGERFGQRRPTRGRGGVGSGPDSTGEMPAQVTEVIEI